MFEVRVKDSRSAYLEVPIGTTFTVYHVSEAAGDIYFMVYIHKGFCYLRADNFEEISQPKPPKVGHMQYEE